LLNKAVTNEKTTIGDFPTAVVHGYE
jgi:hypothetical protein